MKFPSFRDLPFGRKLTLIVMPIAALGLSLAMVAETWLAASTLRRTITEQTHSLAAVVGVNTTGSLSFSDAESATRTLQSLSAIPFVRMACLYLATDKAAPGALLASYVAEAGLQCPVSLADADQRPSSQRLQAIQQVQVAGDTVGFLYLERHLGDLERQIRIAAAAGAAIFALGLILIAALLRILQPRIVAPILALAGKAEAIRRTRDYSLRAERAGHDEVGGLVESFNAMLDEIQRAQKQLVESEKMAALGGLVAGVAHEVNTPIGIGVTGVSHLQQELKIVLEAWEDGTLSRTRLQHFLNICQESTKLVMSHLERAADLVASFKQVAVDQTADDTRDFELGEYLREVVLSLMPKFKNTPHELRVNAPERIDLVSYPGAIAQVVTNLVLNALIHGLDGNGRGLVTVAAVNAGDEVQLTVSDNGKGIPVANHQAVFQPFFTTRRNAGGTGLGLNVVYNLVTQRLRGRIELQSAENAGTRFIVSFPRRVAAP